MSIIQEQFDKLVDQFSMLDTKSVLLGLSGGADSSVLLDLLNKARPKYGFDLKCVHINHMIRADEAFRDENFCKLTCEKLGIELIVVRENIPKYAKERGLGIEEAARNFRYETFDKLCQMFSIQTVATAHNATDNAETLIFNLCRGSSLKGACAIAPKRGNIIRPLLLSSKELILEYAKENGIEYVTDSTNADTAYTRNFIRADIIPSLEKVNSSAIEAMSRFTLSMREASDYLENCASAYVNEDKLSVLSTLDNVILSRVIKQKYSAFCQRDLDHQNVSDIIQMIGKSHSYSSISLSADIDAIVDNGKFYFGKRFMVKKSEDYTARLHFGENFIDQADALIYITDAGDKVNEDYINKKQNIYKLFITKTLVFDKIVGDMYVRPRRDSDRYLINGVNRSVKKYMCDEKFDRSLRFTTPFLCDNLGIFWIPGMRERDGLRPGDIKDNKLIKIYYFQNRKEV